MIAIIVTISAMYRGQTSSAIKPTADWGPGDRAYLDDWYAFLYRQAYQCKQHPHGGGPGAIYGYDNYGMQYPPPPGYAGYPQQTFHM